MSFYVRDPSSSLCKIFDEKGVDWQRRRMIGFPTFDDYGTERGDKDEGKIIS
jgi:hypothetical protein